MDWNVLLPTIIVIVGFLICLICCGGMLWMMIRGHEKNCGGEPNDKRLPAIC